VGLIDEKKTEGRKSRVTVPLRGQSHEKVGEVKVWGVSLGHNSTLEFGEDQGPST
jgi:hypothetical protein